MVFCYQQRAFAEDYLKSLNVLVGGLDMAQKMLLQARKKIHVSQKCTHHQVRSAKTEEKRYAVLLCPDCWFHVQIYRRLEYQQR